MAVRSGMSVDVDESPAEIRLAQPADNTTITSTRIARGWLFIQGSLQGTRTYYRADNFDTSG